MEVSHAVCLETAGQSTSSSAKIGNYLEICKKKRMEMLYGGTTKQQI